MLDIPLDAGAIILQVGEPIAAKRPSGVFLTLMTLLLGGAAILGGKPVAVVVVAVAVFAIAAWLVLTWLARDALNIVSVCENGLIVSSARVPIELVPWENLRTLAMTTSYVRFGGVHRALRFDFGRTAFVVLSDDELDALSARVVDLAKLRSVSRDASDQPFDSGVLLLWTRSGS